MIISIHLPKTAGTSFSALLETHFGAKLLRDSNGDLGCSFTDGTLLPHYEKFKAMLVAGLRINEMDWAGIECIHGHIHAIKYLLMGYKHNAQFVTWMRNPVDRAVSHYYYWKRLGSTPTTALHEKFITENWSLERYCLGPEQRNLYWEMLWGFPLEYFDFIGITEFYADDIEYFARHYLDSHVNEKKLNVGDNTGRPYPIGESLRMEIEAFHERDMNLFKKALEIRLIRCKAKCDTVGKSNLSNI